MSGIAPILAILLPIGFVCGYLGGFRHGFEVGRHESELLNMEEQNEHSFPEG